MPRCTTYFLQQMCTEIAWFIISSFSFFLKTKKCHRDYCLEEQVSFTYIYTLFLKIFSILLIYIFKLYHHRSQIQKLIHLYLLKVKIFVCMCVYLFPCVYVCSLSHMWTHVIGWHRLMPDLIVKYILHLITFLQQRLPVYVSSLVDWDGVQWGPRILFFLLPLVQFLVFTWVSEQNTSLCLYTKYFTDRASSTLSQNFSLLTFHL